MVGRGGGIPKGRHAFDREEASHFSYRSEIGEDTIWVSVELKSDAESPNHTF